jgi:cyclophilin family peptidyl-prolyl cis-trans isomerase
MFAAAMALAVLVVGCGSTEPAKTGTSATSKTATVSNVDVTSGCWKASDRVKVTGGDNTVAGELQWSKPPEMAIDVNKTYTATVDTNKGTFKVEFYPADAPKTVNNFICLAKAGYYDNTPFHRIIDGFVIQGGDPTGTGRGGPGYRFEDEPIKRNYELGTLAMANAGPNTNGSQFFVITGSSGMQLPKNYTIFGKVVVGMDVINTISKTPTKSGSGGEKSSPVEPITLQKVIVEESQGAATPQN